MYTPQYMVETDRSRINEVIAENAFATLIFTSHNIPHSFHLPLILEGEKLIVHMAQSKSVAERLNVIEQLEKYPDTNKRNVATAMTKVTE